MNDVVAESSIIIAKDWTPKIKIFSLHLQGDGTIGLKWGLRRFAYQLGLRLWSQTKVQDLGLSER